MKLGYLTGISEEECKIASRIGYDCLEVQCGWKVEQLKKADYRKAEVDKVLAMLAKHKLSISALATYGSLPENPAERPDAYATLIKFCTELGVNCIAAMARYNPALKMEEALKEWQGVFSKVAPFAEEAGVNIAFENWPGLQSNYPPVGSINLAFSPVVWEQMFQRVPSPAIGLEFDPSHLVWQGIDWAAQLRTWIKRVHHVHAKDTETFEDRLKARGFFSGGWWRYRLPGYGCVDWHKLTSILKENGYNGGICVEHEDGVFLGERRVEGLEKAYATLKPLV